MEDRKFCSKCKAPAVKDAEFCVVCGNKELVSSILDESKVKGVEIEDGVVGPANGGFFLKKDDDTPVRAEEATEPVVEDNVTDASDMAVASNASVQSERTVAYKSFEEYEKEMAEKQQDIPEDDGEDKPKGSVLKKIGMSLLGVFLALCLLGGGFVLGVHLTLTGVLDDFITTEEDARAMEQQNRKAKCFENQSKIAGALADYITENSVYIDKTTTITIEFITLDENRTMVVEVFGECLSESDVMSAVGEGTECPSGGVYSVELIPYIDADGKSMFKVEVVCDAVEGECTHA